MKLATAPNNDPRPSFSLHVGDALDRLDDLNDGSIQLVITSPPYNIGKSYERDNRMSIEQYLDWLKPIIEKICQKVTDEGSVCWQVGNFVKNGEVIPLDYLFYGLFQAQGMKLRNRIIWRFNFGLNAKKRFSGRYETLLWFTKSDNYKFNLDPVRVPQLYPGKRHSSKKEGKGGTLSGNPKGKNPSDVWTFSANDFFESDPVWDIPNVKAGHPEKTIHPCQFPHELAERCVLAFTDMGDTVLDPFMGAGTSAIAAINAGRHAIGIDKDGAYVDVARSRLQALQDGTLKLRPSGRPVRQPNQRDAVARMPEEWTQKGE